MPHASRLRIGAAGACSTIAVAAALAAPAPAWAHSTAPTVALDFRLAISPQTRALDGVRVSLVDGDRGLRLAVSPTTELVVLGYVGEPVVRFSRSGVWVNAFSPTAVSDGLVSRSASGGPAWRRVSAGHELTWHDHRLAPPRGAAAGFAGRWSIPVRLTGRETAISGTFWRVPSPPLWPWLLGGGLLAAGLALVGLRFPGLRAPVAAAVAGVAAAAALAAIASFSLADAARGTSARVQLAAAGALAVAAVVSLVRAPLRTRGWAATAIGAVAAAMGLGSLGVFRHGVVVSALPDAAARLATGLAVVGGCAAAALAIFADSAARPKGRRA